MSTVPENYNRLCASLKQRAETLRHRAAESGEIDVVQFCGDVHEALTILQESDAVGQRSIASLKRQVAGSQTLIATQQKTIALNEATIANLERRLKQRP